MKRRGLGIWIALAAAMILSGTAFGEDQLTETIANGCKEELSTY